MVVATRDTAYPVSLQTLHDSRHVQDAKAAQRNCIRVYQPPQGGVRYYF